MTVGDGRSVSFWYDAWGAPPIRALKDGGPRLRLQNISLREMITRWPMILPFSTDLTPDFCDRDDVLIWRWSKDGTYSSASVYKVMITAGKMRWRYADIWHSFAPAKVKFFTFLFLYDRILTHDTMRKRVMECEAKCVMCSKCPLETISICFSNVDTQLRFGIVWVSSYTSRRILLGGLNPYDLGEIMVTVPAEGAGEQANMGD